MADFAILLYFFIAALSSSFSCSVFGREVGHFNPGFHHQRILKRGYHNGQCFGRMHCLQIKCQANKRNGNYRKPSKFFF